MKGLVTAKFLEDVEICFFSTLLCFFLDHFLPTPTTQRTLTINCWFFICSYASDFFESRSWRVQTQVIRWWSYCIWI